MRNGLPVAVAGKSMALEREKRKLRQANETLRRASACFAMAERPRIEDHREDACAMRHKPGKTVPCAADGWKGSKKISIGYCQSRFALK
jgi:hypothetical protein